jgi:hypothetical protein
LRYRVAEVAAGEAEHTREIGRQGAAIVEEIIDRPGDVLLAADEPAARAERRGQVGDEGEPEEINPEYLSDVLESLAQAKRREFATDAKVEAAFRRFDR